MNYTYLLRCSDGTLYCGWTNDLQRRLAAHNAGTGARYTRVRRPVRLVWWEASETKEEAMRREYRIKRLPRREKLRLVEAFGAADGPRARCAEEADAVHAYIKERQEEHEG